MVRELVKPRYLVAVVGAVVVVGAVLTSVLGSGAHPAPAASPGVGVPGSSLAVDPAACPLPAVAPGLSPSGQPSPSASQAAFDDAGTILLVESSGGDPDEGAGRLRLCVDGVDPIDIGIGCQWSVDRSSVDLIGGSADRPGGGQAFASLELSGGRSGERKAVTLSPKASITVTL